MDASQFHLVREVSLFWWVVVLGIGGVTVRLGVYIWDRHNKDIASISLKLTKQGEVMQTGFDKLDAKIDMVEKTSTPFSVYEQNRQEMRQGQIQIFTQLSAVSSALARIEGKLEAQKKDN